MAVRLQFTSFLVPLCASWRAHAPAWFGSTDPRQAVRRSISLIGSIAAFICLVLIPTQPTYAILPWPVFSATAETAVYIVWRTDVAGTSQVNYGLTSAYGSRTTLDSSLVVYHAQTITGLVADTTYHYQVVSTDASNNTVHSPDQTFTTLAHPTGTVKVVNSAGGGDYLTITACAAAAQPGWTCDVYPGRNGIYNERVTFSGSGSPASPITLQAEGAVIVAGFSLASQSYVNIQGFEITTVYPGSSYDRSCKTENHGIYLSAADHIVIRGNYIHNLYAGSLIRTDHQPAVYPSYVSVINNIGSMAGMIAPLSPAQVAELARLVAAGAYPVMIPSDIAANAPCAFAISSGYPGVNAYINYGLFEGNDFSDVDHLFEVVGSYNVIRQNVFHDSDALDWAVQPIRSHVDFYHPQAVAPFSQIHSLLENNLDANNDYSDQHFGLIDDPKISTVTLGIGDGVQRTFSGTLSSTPIVLRSVVVSVLSGSKSVLSVGDNGFGTINNYGLGFSRGISSGTINYTTGAISVTFKRAPARRNTVSVLYTPQTASHDVILRFNTAYYLGSYFMLGAAGGVPGIRMYNNTLFHVGYNGVAAQQEDYPITVEPNQPNAAFLNNILYDTAKPNFTPWYVDATSPLSEPISNLLLYLSACRSSCTWLSPVTSAPGMVLNQNPNFASGSTYNFSLSAGSPALGAGGPLTTVASRDVGSGTSLVANDAGFFQDGTAGGTGGYYGDTVHADCIAVTAASNTVCITSIDYSTNTIRLAAGITRKAGDPVWLVSDSTGTNVLLGKAPNIGASIATGEGSPTASAAPAKHKRWFHKKDATN